MGLRPHGPKKYRKPELRKRKRNREMDFLVSLDFKRGTEMAANACLRLPAATAVRAEEGVPSSKSTQEKLRLYLTKPSWIVTTQSGAKTEISRRMTKGRCVVCHGTGRVDCFNCSGKGRTNCVDMEMLPRGEWPKWCRSCGGSGLCDCSRCLGTGEYRYIMGFRFLNQHDDVDPK